MSGLSPRVNSSMLPKWVGKTVRLPCHLVKFNDDGTLTVRAVDDGQVLIQVPSADSAVSENYIEIIGKVIDATTIQMLGCVELGPAQDMKGTNDTITLIHDPRFFTKVFCY